MEKKFKAPEIPNNNEPVNGDVRVVNLPVEVLFEFSDKIIDEYDYETKKIISYKSGFIMHVLDNQKFIYNNDHTVLVGNVKFESNIKENGKEKND